VERKANLARCPDIEIEVAFRREGKAISEEFALAVVSGTA
jgi:hypothetical protein